MQGKKISKNLFIRKEQIQWLSQGLKKHRSNRNKTDLMKIKKKCQKFKFKVEKKRSKRFHRKQRQNEKCKKMTQKVSSKMTLQTWKMELAV